MKDIVEGLFQGVEDMAPSEASVGENAMDAELSAEAEALKLIYPDFDFDAQMQAPMFGELLRGEKRPTLKDIYELCHQEEIVREKVEKTVALTVAEAVEKAVTEAVTRTVAETEQRMLSQIRARGQRPAENGLNAALGVRTHPAVDRLTKADRERLARRASRGETIRL